MAEERYGGRFSFTGSLRTRAARGTLINTGFDIGIGVLGLARGFVLAGFVSKEAYGVWGVILVSLTTLVWFKQAGIGDKFVQQEEPDQELAFQRAFTFELALTSSCVLLMAAALPALVAIYDLPQLVAPGLVFALTLLITVFQAPQWIYYRRMEFGRQRALAAVDPVVGFIVSIGLAIAGAGYWSFVGGIAAGATASALASVWRSPYKLRLRWHRSALSTYTSFSGPLLVGGAAIFVMAWSGFIAAKLELGVAAVGVIALATNVSSFTDRVDALVTGALYPALCAVRDRTELLYESLVKSNRLALIWAVPFGVGVTLFCSDLVRFGIGERWRPAVTVLEVYGIVAAINHVGFNWTAYFRAIDRTRPIMVVSIAACVTFLAVGIPLLFAIGLPGFAAGMGAQAMVAVVMRAFYLQRLFPGFHFLRHAARAFLPTVPAAGAVLILRAVGSGQHNLAFALAQLATFLLVTVIATWYLESDLIREAVGQLLDRRPRAAVY
jgi:PST family polysaccharide transporter